MTICGSDGHCWHPAGDVEAKSARAALVAHAISRGLEYPDPDQEMAFHVCCREHCGVIRSLTDLNPLPGPADHCVRQRLVIAEKGHEWRDVCADAIRLRRDELALVMLLGHVGIGVVTSLRKVEIAAKMLADQMMITQTTGDPPGPPRVRVKDDAAAWQYLGDLERAVEQSMQEEATSQLAMLNLDRRLRAEGFDRIGRIDAVGRRSLWLKVHQHPGERPHAIELRAGREGDDSSVIIKELDFGFRDLLDVMMSARFAAEWEQRTGYGLNLSDPRPALDEAAKLVTAWRNQDGFNASMVDTLAREIDRYFDPMSRRPAPAAEEAVYPVHPAGPAGDDPAAYFGAFVGTAATDGDGDHE